MLLMRHDSVGPSKRKMTLISMWRARSCCRLSDSVDRLSDFILIPGAWLNGRCWHVVAADLVRRGHRAWPVTLPGLGLDLQSVDGRTITLDDHVEFVVSLIRREVLDGVCLVGHSYAGLVTGSVANLLPDRVRQLVYVDANLPRDQRSLLDDWSDAGRTSVLEQAETNNGRWPPPHDLGAAGSDLTPRQRRALVAEMTAHPIGTLTQPARLSDGPYVPTVYVQCTISSKDLSKPVADLLSTGAQLEKFSVGHWPMASAPRRLADVLTGLI